MTESSNNHKIAGSIDQISVAVAVAIAGTTGHDPASIEPPLYDIIDPDALDSLFNTQGQTESRTDGPVTFTTAGCRITAPSTGVVTATSLDNRGTLSTNTIPPAHSHAIASHGERDGWV